MKTKISNNYFIGINAGHHDASACLYDSDENATYVYEEERLSRKKGKGHYPFKALQKLIQNHDLKELNPRNIGFSVFQASFDKTFELLKKEKKLHFDFFVKNHPLLTDSNSELCKITHHEAHLFSALPFIQNRPTLVLVADGCGSCNSDFTKYANFQYPNQANVNDFEVMSLYLIENENISCVEKEFSPVYLTPETRSRVLPSGVYDASAFAIFGNWKYCGKVMGLAPYFQGKNLSHEELLDYLESAQPGQARTTNEFNNLDNETRDFFINIASSTQHYFEEKMLEKISTYKRKYPHVQDLIFTGGCALNCVFNNKLREANLFTNLIIPPFPNDEGIGIGTALGAYFKQFNKIPKRSQHTSPFVGDPNSITDDAEIIKTFSEYKIQNLGEGVSEAAASLIKEQEIVAWIQGRSECGPRSLGNRSILANPFQKEIKDILNSKIKLRESFRPYGCSLLEEDADMYFENSKNLNSPYMSYAPTVSPNYRELLKEILHIDNTIRIQTVGSEFKRFHTLLNELKGINAHSLVIHTSLNINNEPIVENLEDAKIFFRNSLIKFMVVNNFLISK